MKAGRAALWRRAPRVTHRRRRPIVRPAAAVCAVETLASRATRTPERRPSCTARAERNREAQPGRRARALCARALLPGNQSSSLVAHPRRLEPQHLRVHRAALLMRSGQVARAHQELTGDLTTSEFERLLDQLHPFKLRQRMICVEPFGKRAVTFTNREDTARILDCGVDFEPVAYDALVGKQPRTLRHSVACDPIDVEVVERRAKVCALAQDRDPGESRLVDFEHQTFEQHRFVTGWKAVLSIMVRPMKRMAWSYRAVAHGVPFYVRRFGMRSVTPINADKWITTAGDSCLFNFI